jgi:hypothetical protein
VNRRVLALLGGGAALLALSSCATFDTDNALTVNGTDISVESVDNISRAIGGVEGIRSDFLDEAGNPNILLNRNVIGLLVDNAVVKDLLDERGAPITQAELDTARTQLGSSSAAFLEVDAEAVDALVYNTAVSTALGRIEPLTKAEIETTYARQPAELGLICADVVRADSESAAKDAAAKLASGATAESVAATPLLGTDGVVCPNLGDIAASVTTDAFTAMIDAKPGATIGPIETPGTDGASIWSVYRIQQIADAAEGLTSALASNAGQLAYLGAASTADVVVSTTYGKWDPLTRSVVAISTPSTTDTDTETAAP